jgi:DUF4097 and DUF4098 domain-containing protein YvlB
METRSFDTPGGLQVRLSIPAGEIAIAARDTDRTDLRITGERNADDLEIECRDLPSGGHRLAVAHRARGLGRLTGGDLDVRLEVPTGASVDIETGSADARLDGSLGDVTYKSGSGDVRIAEASGDVAAKVGSGDLSAGPIAGDLTFHSASGDVMASAVGGGLVARTASGDVHVGVVGSSAQATTVSGDIEIGSVSVGTTSLRSVSGDVEVGVVPGMAVYLDLMSTSGDVSSDLDEGHDGSTPDLELSVASVSGDVRVRRASSRDVGV